MKGVYKRKPLSVAGEKNPFSKLTEEQVKEIRISKLSSPKIAPFYNISDAHVRKIRGHKSWSHI